MHVRHILIPARRANTTTGLATEARIAAHPSNLEEVIEQPRCGAAPQLPRRRPCRFELAGRRVEVLERAAAEERARVEQEWSLEDDSGDDEPPPKHVWLRLAAWDS